MSAVEILVPQPALPSVKKALGALPSATFHTHPSPRWEPDLVVSSLELLDTSAGRRALDDLLAAFGRAKEMVVVLFEADGYVPKLAGLEGLARLSHRARHEPYIAPSLDAVRRLVRARRSGAEKQLVASASIENGKLVVWSCEPRRFDVSVSEVPALASMPSDALAEFELSPSGSRILWPRADVDLNLDTIREYADPGVRRRHELEARKDAARYARAIRKFRVERGLKQTEIEGLTQRQVRRLEAGDTVPHFETLKKLAAAHGLSVNDYLAELASRSRAARRAAAT